MESFNSSHEKKREHQSCELKGRFVGARVALDMAPESTSSLVAPRIALDKNDQKNFSRYFGRKILLIAVVMLGYSSILGTVSGMKEELGRVLHLDVFKYVLMLMSPHYSQET